MMIDKICPYCGGNVKSARSSVVYRGSDYGKIYLCSNWPACDAYVGCHNKTGDALGTLANASLRRKRRQVHALFDPTWVKAKDKSKARHKAYKWLAKVLGIHRDDCHVGMFDMDHCERALVILNKGVG